MSRDRAFLLQTKDLRQVHALYVQADHRFLQCALPQAASHGKHRQAVSGPSLPLQLSKVCAALQHKKAPDGVLHCAHIYPQDTDNSSEPAIPSHRSSLPAASAHPQSFLKLLPSAPQSALMMHPIFLPAFLPAKHCQVHTVHLPSAYLYALCYTKHETFLTSFAPAHTFPKTKAVSLFFHKGSASPVHSVSLLTANMTPAANADNSHAYRSRDNDLWQSHDNFAEET